MITPPAPRVSVIDSEVAEFSADGSEELNVSLSTSLVLSVRQVARVALPTAHMTRGVALVAADGRARAGRVVARLDVQVVAAGDDARQAQRQAGFVIRAVSVLSSVPVSVLVSVAVSRVVIVEATSR